MDAAALDALIAELADVGDPLADALVAELATHPGNRASLDRGLREGRESLGDLSGAPALAAYLTELETLTAAAPDDLLESASLPHFTISPAEHVLDLGAAALIHSYAPPRTAAVLVGTGELTSRALERVTDTGRWNAAALVPGWLWRGEPGYVATAQVRLVHARVRRALRRAGEPLDGGSAGVPLHQVDLARTWLDFTLVTMNADAALGLDLTADEQESLYRYWRHLGLLLGVDGRLLAGAVDTAGAQLLAERIAAVTGPPSEDSRRLTRAGLEALAGALSDLMPVPARLAGPMVRAACRAMLGDDLADQLGVPRSAAAAAALRPLVALTRVRRRRLRRDAAAWERLVRANVEATRAFALDGGPAGFGAGGGGGGGGAAPPRRARRPARAPPPPAAGPG
ncbi:oxygenase MpaB family protein, partial [Kineococcus auxinigenes]|uniref:oxygenase MpaB family protein n=1 Tax=Kineococcus sp. SYSU DK033 TaxID=3383154 RepID=UPI003D7EF115